ncbi:MAG: entericidin A/B family lipoprotein [Phycisphaerae bacterium]|nr:entericidin A/B family lipoprotein [Phycisphaerae bacterium]
MSRLAKFVNLVVITVISLVLTGCNTAEGIGRDVERAGEEIQEEARE